MKPKYGDIRPRDGRVFTGYTRVLTKKYGVRHYEQWRSLESLKKNPGMFKKLIASVEARQNATQPADSTIDYYAVIFTIILAALCIYIACL